MLEASRDSHHPYQAFREGRVGPPIQLPPRNPQSPEESLERILKNHKPADIRRTRQYQNRLLIFFQAFISILRSCLQFLLSGTFLR